MKRFRKAILCIFLVLAIGCSKIQYNGLVSENKDFGSVKVMITPDDFKKLGFEYGDSVDIRFSNGFELKNVPFYSGYYERAGNAALVGYANEPCLQVSYCGGEYMWGKSGCKEGDGVQIKLNKKKKYLINQEAMHASYSDERENFESDMVFSNYRVMKAGNLKENMFFRGASGVNNEHKRAKCTNDLIEGDKIKFALNLADNEKKIKRHLSREDFDCTYYKSLYEEGNVELLGLSVSFQSESYAKKLAKGLRAMMKHEGPYYIHCTEGKDRTGFVSLLLEALVGASYEEMESDYMLSYDNYYGINKETDLKKYNAIKDMRLDEMFLFLFGTEDENELKSMDFSKGAKDYLIKLGGMSETEIRSLTKFLSK